MSYRVLAHRESKANRQRQPGGATQEADHHPAPLLRPRTSIGHAHECRAYAGGGEGQVLWSCLTVVLGTGSCASGKAVQVLSPEPLPTAVCGDLIG